MGDRSNLSSDHDPICAGQRRDGSAAGHKVSKSASGAQVLQYGLLAGFVSMAILSTFSSWGSEISSLFWSLASDLLNVTSTL